MELVQTTYSTTSVLFFNYLIMSLPDFLKMIETKKLCNKEPLSSTCKHVRPNQNTINHVRIRQGGGSYAFKVNR
jgi:hypothetical protein